MLLLPRLSCQRDLEMAYFEHSAYQATGTSIRLIHEGHLHY